MFVGVNAECVDGSCDCIRNGAGQCIASPPAKCSDVDKTACDNGQVCNSEKNFCMCSKDAVLIGKQCIATRPLLPKYKHFQSMMAQN